MTMPKNDNIASDDVTHQVNSAIKLLMKLDLPADGFDRNSDSEVWDWVESSDALNAHEELDQAIKHLQEAKGRIAVSMMHQLSEERDRY